MIYRKVLEHHLSRFYNLAHLVKELSTDTDKDDKAKEAIIILSDEWESWCAATSMLFPHMQPSTQMQRLYERGNRGANDSFSNIGELFDQTAELLRRLRLIYEV